MAIPALVAVPGAGEAALIAVAAARPIGGGFGCALYCSWNQDWAPGGDPYYVTDGAIVRTNPNFKNPWKSPGEGWERRGDEWDVHDGAWFNPKTEESLKWGRLRDGHGPHYDYQDRRTGAREWWFPDGRREPKPGSPGAKKSKSG